MINFFRKIRKQLADDNKPLKYMRFAIGEIVLVVLGILIALSINNWNELIREHKIAQQYLKGIKTDLEKDVDNVDQVIQEHTLTISLINSIEGIFDYEVYQPEKYSIFFITPDTSQTQSIFYRGVSYRPIKGTYNSLISDGRSSIIKNKSLFQEIQEIYDELNQRISSTYEALKEREIMIAWEYPYQKKYWTYSDLKNAKKDKIYLDLSNFTEQKYFYSQDLFDLKVKMHKVLKLLELEIETK